eukprot:TRINITY_DN6195_c0_g1_i7.p1 TRINITY_DN6195_c0_g1~~TRINITY_DN6195_c0_g1_i7.p1  ORF type:complete len:275 (-),score=27.34 TRINITY_DN6195_c0_g1_i7:339-1163(-)
MREVLQIYTPKSQRTVYIFRMKSKSFALFCYFLLLTQHIRCHDMEGECKIQEQQSENFNQIIDISTPFTPNVPLFDHGDEGIGEFMTPRLRIPNGDFANIDNLRMDTHMGTHIDSEQHFIDEYRQRGVGIESLDLNILIGPVLVVNFTIDSNITRDALEQMSIPEGTERILFITRNTERNLMYQRQFVTDFVAVSICGAEWMVEKGVKLVGIDYLSVVKYDETVGGHVAFLTARVILVEGLSLAQVKPGLYELICLPLKLQGGNGAPARCVLRK